MKLFKKGFAFLLCGASALLSSCSSKEKVCTIVGLYTIDAFVSIEYDLVQKDIVKFDVSFGVAVTDTETTWEEIVDRYDINYFKLHVYSSTYVNHGSYQEAMEILNTNVEISERITLDVSKNSETKVKEKLFKNKNINDGNRLKMFYVDQNVSIEAERFAFNGDGANFYLDSGVLDTKKNLIQIEEIEHTREVTDGIQMDYTYDDGTVTFEKLTSFASHAPVFL